MNRMEIAVRHIENAKVFDDGTFSGWINEGLKEAIRVIQKMPSNASRASMVDAIKARIVDSFPVRYDVYHIWRNKGLDRAISCM